MEPTTEPNSHLNKGQVMDLEKQFQKYGYIHIPSVLTMKEVKQVRAAIDKKIDEIRHKNPNDLRVNHLMPSDTLKIKDIYMCMFLSKIVKSLKAILGPSYSFFGDIVVQRNMFGAGKYGGWHVDSGSEGYANYLRKNDYRFVKCGLYLQENTNDWGIGSQLEPQLQKLILKLRILLIDGGQRIKRFRCQLKRVIFWHLIHGFLIHRAIPKQ
jgi:hypothetical protein